MEKQQVIGRCIICGWELTKETVYIGDRGLLCPVHVHRFTKEKQAPDPEIPRYYRCTVCGEAVPESEVHVDNDGLLCQYCGRYRRVILDLAKDSKHSLAAADRHAGRHPLPL